MLFCILSNLSVQAVILAITMNNGSFRVNHITILNRSGAPANCWLLCMSDVCYLLDHISCESLKGQIPLTKLYGVTPDISILIMYTFCQSVYYASPNQSFPSTSEERHAFWVGFGEHVGDAITHKLLDSSSNKIIYRSSFCPPDDLLPNKCLLPDLGESVGSNKPKPITLVKFHQDLDKSVSKPMAEYNPDVLIGRTFLLSPYQKGEKQRALIKQKVIEISDKLDEDQNTMVDTINFLLDVSQRRSQAIISYKQVLNYLEKENQEDESLYKLRAITDHHGPLKKNDPNNNSSLYNVMVEWETGEITEEPLSIIAQDDPVTCAAYAMKHNLLHLPIWSKLKHIAKHQETLTRAINQTKIIKLGDLQPINLLT